MNSASLVMWLFALGGLGAVAFAVTMIWKTIVGLKEEDVVILDPAEDNLATEQAQTVARVQRLTVWAKGFGFSALAVLVLAGALSLINKLHFAGQ